MSLYLFLSATSLGCLFHTGYCFKDRLKPNADGSFLPLSLAHLYQIQEPNIASHPHLFASETQQPYTDLDLDLSAFDHGDDVAVVFHSFVGAGKSLLLSQIHRSDPSLNMTELYSSIKFKNGMSTLNIFNVPHFSGDPCLEKSKIDMISALIQAYELPLKRIYIICDANSFNEGYAQDIDCYLKQLHEAYGSSYPNRFCIIFNKADLVTADRIADHTRLLGCQASIASLPIEFDTISVSARDCIGQLIGDLKSVAKRPDPAPKKSMIEEVTASQTSTNMIIMMLHSMKAAIDQINSVFVIVPEYLLQKSHAQSDQIAEFRWILEWLQDGAPRDKYVDYRFQYEEHYQDTKANYEAFRDAWTERREELKLYISRIDQLQQVGTQLQELKTISDDVHDDLLSELGRIQAARNAREAFLNGFQLLVTAK